MSKSVGQLLTSFLAKILFGVLIVAFGAWGIADMLRRSPDHQAVIKVGDVEVSGQQVKRAFLTELRRLRDQFGPQLTAADAQNFGVFDQVLSQMASRALLDAAAKDMNVGISDEAVQKLITGNAAFVDQSGKFSPDRFQRVLASNGYREADFLAATRGDMTRQRILESVRGPVIAPDILVNTLIRYEGERRIALEFPVKAAAMPVPADPGDDVLKAYQTAHAATYTAPETRKLTVMPLRPEDVAGKITVSEDALKAYFEQHAAEYAKPEERKLSQILLKDEAAAAKVAAALTEGRAPAAVAKESGGTLTDLGWVVRDGLLSALGDPAFAAAKGAVLPPLKTPLGWHVVIVQDIHPQEGADFASVRAKVEQAVKAEQILSTLYSLSTAVEDSLAAGSSIEETAKLNGLSAISVDGVTAEGKLANGSAPQGIPSPADVVKAGFGQDIQTVSPMMEYEGEPGGYFVVRTDAITPAALKPFADVRDDVLSAWRGEKQQAAAVAKAKELAAALADAKDVDAFAKANGVKIETTPPLFRSTQGDLPRELVAGLFTLEPGQATSTPAPEGAVVARLKEVQPVDPRDFAASLDQGKRKLRAALGDSLMGPFTTQLADTFKMKQLQSTDRLVQELK
jgi:peptidyl-prolyl cis-trans isomerase D